MLMSGKLTHSHAHTHAHTHMYADKQNENRRLLWHPVEHERQMEAFAVQRKLTIYNRDAQKVRLYILYNVKRERKQRKRESKNVKITNITTNPLSIGSCWTPERKVGTKVPPPN